MNETTNQEPRPFDGQVRAGFVIYHIWWRRHGASLWTQTNHTVKARTDEEAESKTRRNFSSAGFHGMSMVAVESGKSPNNQPQGRGLPRPSGGAG